MNAFFFFLLVLSFFLLGATTLPFFVVFLILATVFYPKSFAFLLAFIFGIILDVFNFQLLGKTSVFFCLLLFTLFLYERKFEIKTAPFVFFATFLGSFFYLWFFGYQMIFMQSLVSSIIAVLIFKFL